MELIDEEGRLFGVVNVIDALAVLLVLAVVVAGFALVNPFAPGAEETTRYATIDLGEQPEYVAELVSAGDLMSPANTPRNLTITDVYVTPGENDNVSITVRARINGTLQDREGGPGQVFTYADMRVSQGSSLTVDTGDYSIGGTVTRMAEDGPSLDTDQTRAVMTASVSPATARSIETGQTVTVTDREVARITQVDVAPGGDATTRQITLGVELETLGQPGGPAYGGAPLALDRTVSFNPGSYQFQGRIDALGTDEIQTETAAVTVGTTLDEAASTRLDVGDTYQIADRSVAEITAIQRFPDPGSDQHQLVLGLELETVRDEGDRFFGPNRVAIGQGIPFRTDVTSFSGTIRAIGDSDLDRESAQAVIRTTVDEDVSELLAVGDWYRLANHTVAEITALQRFPGQNADQHQVVLGLEFETVRVGGDRYFGGTRIAVGQSLPFQTDQYSLSGSMFRIGTSDLDRESTQAVIETNVPTRVGDEMAVGDEYRLAGTTVGTIRSIDTYPTGGQGQKRIVAGVDLTTVRRGGEQFFGASPLRLGSTIPFETDAYQLSGTVIGRDSLTPPGETTTKTIVVKVANVHPEIADGIRVGMTEEGAEDATARLVDKRTESADVILTSEDGEIFERQHPRNQDVYLTVEVTVRSTRTGLRFHSQPLQEGNTITLDFRTISVDGTVIEIQ
jgi:hypothetical protein